MTISAESLLRLLPAIYQLRDAEAAAAMEGLAAEEQRGPLASLLAVFAPELEAMEESLAQLYDDLFIETCAAWMIPYIGDLIGYEPLHPLGEDRDRARADVAHTIALRRRKGTAPVLEQLAVDGTGWSARVVECFERLQATQHLNHRRPHVRQTLNLRDGEALSWLGTPFETAQRTVDVRSIAQGRPRPNIAHVGVHLWRIEACPRTRTSATRVGEGRFRVSPLGQDTPLYQLPEPEATISHLAEPRNVPLPLGRRYLKTHLDRLYGEPSEENPDPRCSLLIWVNGSPDPVPRAKIRVCHLGDHAGGWGHTPPAGDGVAVDPALGRIALAASYGDSDATPAEVKVLWHEGFTAMAQLGGGEYPRHLAGAEITPQLPVVRVPRSGTASDTYDTVFDALNALKARGMGGQGIVEISDSGSHDLATLAIQAPAEGVVVLRAAQGVRPVLELQRLELRGGPGSRIVLDGLVLQGGPVVVAESGAAGLERLELRHCTLVPGLARQPDGSPRDPQAVSLSVAAPSLRELVMERCICGAIRAPASAALRAEACLIDATAASHVALMAEEVPGGMPEPGPELSLRGCTVVGRLLIHAVGEISDCVLLAEAGPGWEAPLRSERRQAGCVRFSWIPPGSLLPASYHCQPADRTARLPPWPVFTSLRYGHPAYGRLSAICPEVIRRGGEDDNEMGVFAHLWLPQRESNLQVRLAEYLRLGLNAGILYES